ncbi:MAG TPA: hypothetical protein EYP67_07300 [Methanosarcinales archaeon]|nr:hypothetical protein [Methanosarcinales archaeon]
MIKCSQILLPARIIPVIALAVMLAVMGGDMGAHPPAINHSGDYTVVMTYGQTPYQLGYRTNTSTGWDWWDEKGANRQKNIVLLNVFENVIIDGKPSPTHKSGLSISVDVTYPTDDLSTNSTTIALAEDGKHEYYYGVFYYPNDAYTGVYDVDFRKTIDSIDITLDTNFTTTLWGCQARGCHDAWSLQTDPSERNSTTVIHPNKIVSGSMENDCQIMCHSPYAAQFLTATPVHLHEIQYGHEGGFICGESGWVTIFEANDSRRGEWVLSMYAESDLVRPRGQTRLTDPSHVFIAECTDCHTSFIHDEEGSETHDIAAPYVLNGTVAVSTGVHSGVACDLCHGGLEYPEVPNDQYSLSGVLGSYAPTFTSYQRSEETYVLNVSGGRGINVSVTCDDPAYNFTLSLIGPIDDAAGIQDLNKSDNWHGTYYVPSVDASASFASGSRIYRPKNATLASYSVFDDDAGMQEGTWIARIFGWSPGLANYTITSSNQNPIAYKPIIHIPTDCSECHKPDPDPPLNHTNASADIPIPNWDTRGLAHIHADVNGDGEYDVACRSCHNSLHEISILSCTDCHTMISGGHRGIPPELLEGCQKCHFEPHYEPWNASLAEIIRETDRSYGISAGEICGFVVHVPRYTRWIEFNSTWYGEGVELIAVRPSAVTETGVNISEYVARHVVSEYATSQGHGGDWNLNLTDEMRDLRFDGDMVLLDDQNTSHKFIRVDNPESGAWYGYIIRRAPDDGLGASDDTNVLISTIYGYNPYPGCIICHDSTLPPDPENRTTESNFVVSAFEKGIHARVNGAEDDINRSCWACHWDGTVSSEHRKKKMNCSNNDCHTFDQSKYREPMIYEHFKDADILDNPGNLTTSNISTTVGCDACHLNSIVETTDPVTSGTYRVSHYGSTDELMAYPDSILTDCVYCHEDMDNAEEWGDAIDPTDLKSDLICEDEKATMLAGDLWELRNGYILKVVNVDLSGNSTLVQLIREGEVIDEHVIRGDKPFLYEEEITDDNSTFDQTIVSVNLTGVMRGGEGGVATLEGRTIRRIHPETENRACYACHMEGYARNDRYTIVDRKGNVTYYTKLLIDFDDAGESSKTLGSGEDWDLGEGFVLTVKHVDINGDLAMLELRENGVVVEDDVVNTSDLFEYEKDISPLTDVPIFRANISGVFRSRGADLAVLDGVRLISPDISDADKSDIDDEDKLRVDGYNVSWISVGENFGGAEPDTFHVPPLVNGWDIVFANCIQCHDLGTGMDIKRVDAIDSQLGAHAELNADASASDDALKTDPIVRACWACHGIGLEPGVHPDKTPKDCVDCHVHEILFDAVDISGVPHGKVRNCTSCHGKSGYDPHVITAFGAVPHIGNIKLSPQSCYEGETVVIDAVAVSGWMLEVTGAEYFIDFTGSDGTGTPMMPVDGAFDSNTEEITAKIDTTGLLAGNHTIIVHAMESEDTWGRTASATLHIKTGRKPLLVELGSFVSSIPAYWYAVVLIGILILYGFIRFAGLRSRKQS